MRYKKRSNVLTTWLGRGLLASGATSMAFAGLVNIDFNTDPTGTGLFRIVSSEPVPWRATGGVNNSGYLAITDARESQSTHIAFGQLDDPDLVVASFTFECDLRLGGGRAAPADGFSLNIVSSDDPLITQIEAGQAPNTYAGTNDEASLPEEGSRTGLGIGFDTWQSGLIGSVQDVVGISVRADGQLVAQFPVPLRPGNIFLPTMPNPGAQGSAYVYDQVPYRNLAVGHENYASSMQTGALSDEDLNGNGSPGPETQPQPPYGDPDWDKWVKNLTWERFKAEVTQSGHVKIWWKGVELTPEGGLPTNYRPIKGARIVFAGRTGGNHQVHHVDNIRLETFAATVPVISGVTASPIGFSVTITDSGRTSDPNTLKLQLNGEDITPTRVDYTGGVLTAEYMNTANPLPSGSTHQVYVYVQTPQGDVVEGTLPITIPVYLSLPPSFAVAGANTRGFVVDTYHLDRNVPNSVQRAERQLHGDLGPNIAVDAFYQPITRYIETGVINYSQHGGPPGYTPEQAGFFQAPGKPDQLIPGHPSFAQEVFPDGDRDNLALAINTVLHFPKQGYYTLNVTSDDGFRTTFWKNGREKIASMIAAQFDGGRGADSGTSVVLYIAEPGYYPAQTIWFEGQGGANIEWSAITMDSNGQRYLINDNEPGALQAFQVATGSIPSAVVFADPVRDSGNPYDPTIPLRFDIANGSSPVDAGSIKVLVGGVEMTRTVSAITGGQRITVNPPGGAWAGGTREVRIQFAEQGGGQYDAAYNVTFRSWTAIPPSLAMQQGQVGPRGFLVRTVQQIGVGRGNNRFSADAQLAGFIGLENTVNPAPFGADGWFRETQDINYEQGALVEGNWVPQNAGNFNPNRLYPGIPGGPNRDNTDNFAIEVLTVLHFPTAGFYWFGVNSDDGFHVTAGNPKDANPPLLGIFDGGRGAGDTWYVVRITQPGYYPIRLVQYEGGGGASGEWFSLTPPNDIGAVTRTLVNADGGVAAYQYPIESAGVPYVKAFGPGVSGRGNNAPLSGRVNLIIEDGIGNVAPGSISMTYAGAAVTPTVAKNGSTTTVTYAPDAPLALDTPVSVVVNIGDRPLAWTFRTAVGAAPTGDVAFYIEAEDFNHGGGQTQAAASALGYMGGAYARLGAVLDTDYQRPHQADAPIYRMGEVNNVPFSMTNNRDRGAFELAVNFRIGWVGDGQWYRYTRDFPAGTYEVWAGLSHGDSGATMGGRLYEVVGGEPTQLGSFSRAGTGGWDTVRLVPLRDEAGNIKTVSLSGTRTLQYTTVNGDVDFFLFTVPGEAPDVPVFNLIARNPDGTITVEWTGGGTLQAAPTVNGPWQNVTGATSPYTFTPTDAMLFGRIVR